MKVKLNICICPLPVQVLFNGYQFSEEQVLPPTALRNTLAVLHRGLDRFQVGELDDAAEALVPAFFHDRLIDYRTPTHRLLVHVSHIS